MIGRKFGRLTLIEKIVIKWRTHYKCVCECGNEVTVKYYNLKLGGVKSCGCLKKEKLFKEKFIHGHSIGMKTKEYRAWQNMKNRCYNPKCERFEHYGGRGIKVCDRWLNSFENFLSDVGEAPSQEYSIDRINNDGNYEPNNVKWSTMFEQVHNRKGY